MVITTCSCCGRSIEVKPYRLTRSAKLFCSNECRTKDGTTRRGATPRAVERTCPTCGKTFTRKPAELRAANYCSRSCSAKANMSLSPIPKGERRGRGTEFSGPPHNTLPVGTVTIRKRPGRDDVRAWVKVAEPNAWRPRAVVEWEKAHGPVPKGYVIHHVDHDSLNDDPANLQALSRGDHAALHSSLRNMPTRSRAR